MGIFNSFAEMNVLAERAGSSFTEAEILEEMEYLENLGESTTLTYDDPIEACFEAMLQNQINYDNIMMAVAHEEMEYFMKHGTEMVYEGAKLDAFISRLKEMVDKAWEKIKAVFTKALKTIQSWIATDKKFVDKHEKAIKAGSPKARTIMNTYNIQTDKVADSEGYMEVAREYKEEIAKLNNKDLIADGTPFNPVKILTGLDTAAEFRDGLETDFGLSKAGSAGPIPADEIIKELKEGKTNKKNVKKAYDNAKRAISEIKKTIDKDISKFKERGTYDQTDEKGKTKTMSLGRASQLCSTALTLLSTCQSVQLKAMSVHHSNCRKAARRCVQGIKEGFEFDTDDDDYGYSDSYSYIN